MDTNPPAARTRHRVELVHLGSKIDDEETINSALVVEGAETICLSTVNDRAYIFRNGEMIVAPTPKGSRGIIRPYDRYYLSTDFGELFTSHDCVVWTKIIDGGPIIETKFYEEIIDGVYLFGNSLHHAAMIPATDYDILLFGDDIPRERQPSLMSHGIFEGTHYAIVSGFSGSDSSLLYLTTIVNNTIIAEHYNDEEIRVDVTSKIVNTDIGLFVVDDDTVLFKQNNSSNWSCHYFKIPSTKQTRWNQFHSLVYVGDGVFLIAKASSIYKFEINDVIGRADGSDIDLEHVLTFDGDDFRFYSLSFDGSCIHTLPLIRTTVYSFQLKIMEE